jgi:putative FmdB family regulatory protein
LPIYRYKCSACEQSIEVQAKVADAAPTQVPGCVRGDCRLTKQLGPIAITNASKSSLNAAKSHLAQASELLANSNRDPASPDICRKYCDLHK